MRGVKSRLEERRQCAEEYGQNFVAEYELFSENQSVRALESYPELCTVELSNQEKSVKDSSRVLVPFAERGALDSPPPRFNSRNNTMNFGHVSVKTELTVKDKLLIGDPTEYKMSNTL